MDEQMSVKSPAGTSISACHKREASPFLRLPREIRNLIYSHVVTVDQVFEGDRTGNYNDYRTLPSDMESFRINRQIWAEVWDHLITSNIWVEVSTNERLAGFFSYQAFWYPCSRFPSSLASPEHIKHLADAVAIRFEMEGASDSKETIIFAYHPLTYGSFLSALSDAVTSQEGVSVQPSTRTLQCDQRFAKLVTPLCTLCGQGRASFLGTEDAPTTLQQIQESMNRPEFDADSIDGIMMNRQHYLDQGRTAELRGRFSDAMCQYWLGCTSQPAPEDYFAEGTPEWNSIYAMDTELRIRFSRNAHRYLASQKDTAARCNIDGEHETWIANMAEEASTDALEQFVGLSDRQRSEAHLYRAFIFLHQGQYYCAAEDLFYAKEADLSRDLATDLEDEYDRAAYEAIQRRPGPQGFKLAEQDLPLLGTWKGDPYILKTVWNGNHVILMKLLRQRHNRGPEGEEGGEPQDLAPQYALQDFTWEHKDNGEIKVSAPIDFVF
ncbi:hypothetical protein PG993_013697 [Apiospora rasikravindrae]|uniref:Uncharacterized protein n=1 Tax=Apiospora rasikravindrae TaxID=990691 RepID=A0ABR1RQX0_9PEZI